MASSSFQQSDGSTGVKATVRPSFRRRATAGMGGAPGGTGTVVSATSVAAARSLNAYTLADAPGAFARRSSAGVNVTEPPVRKGMVNENIVARDDDNTVG